MTVLSSNVVIVDDAADLPVDGSAVFGAVRGSFAFTSSTAEEFKSFPVVRFALGGSGYRPYFANSGTQVTLPAGWVCLQPSEY